MPMMMSELTRILLIEDEPAIADTVIYALKTEGFEPVWCNTGSAGLNAIQDAPPALIILDIGLPDYNGFELFKEIQYVATLPVIFLTARAEEIDRVVGLEIGADDYIVKPFSPRELTARVRAVLRRAQSATANDNPAQPTAPFAIDTERYQIRYYEHTLALSRYEYRLLKILIERPQRIFSREDLLQLAWEYPDNSLDRTVDTHIKTIRAKLRAVKPTTNPIKTHRGIGYSLSFDE